MTTRKTTRTTQQQHPLTLSKRLVIYCLAFGTVLVFIGIGFIVNGDRTTFNALMEFAGKLITPVMVTYFGKSGIENIFKYNDFGNKNKTDKIIKPSGADDPAKKL